MTTTNLYVILFGFLIATPIQLIAGSALIPMRTSGVTMIPQLLPIVVSFYVRPTVGSQLKGGGQVWH